MARTVIPEHVSYTFADYFAFNLDTKDVLAYFDYSFIIKKARLPHTHLPPERVDLLGARIEKSLPHLSLTSEIARREFLIAPVLLEVVDHTQAWIRVEYPLSVNDQLKGTLDSYLQTEDGSLLVVEAKNADLARGFTQLAVELVALDLWLN